MMKQKLAHKIWCNSAVKSSATPELKSAEPPKPKYVQSNFLKKNYHQSKVTVIEEDIEGEQNDVDDGYIRWVGDTRVKPFKPPQPPYGKSVSMI